jgi:glycine/D-amino acid oxidase-like deaminating enzyme
MPNGKLKDLVQVQLQKSFVASIPTGERTAAEIVGMHSDGHVGFFIVDGGYVRVTKHGDKLTGHYGGALEDLTLNPAVTPDKLEYSPRNISARVDYEFPAELYWSLGRVAKGYEEGTLASAPSGEILVGYYTTMVDHLPVVSSTAIKGLNILSGLMGEGVMLSPALAEQLTAIMTGRISEEQNVYSLQRNFGQKVDALVL